MTPDAASARWARVEELLAAGLVDEVVAYVAPLLLGAGRSAVGDLGIATIADALHLDVRDVTVLGDGTDSNVRLLLSPRLGAAARTTTTTTTTTTSTTDCKDG